MPGNSAPRYAALLRGINVGGKNLLPMAGLKSLFTAAGCTEVSTYIASGNVIFNCSAALLPKLPEVISRYIKADFGLTIPVILRTAPEMARVVDANPFLPLGIPAKELHVAFLCDRPHASVISRLDPDRSPPDSFRVLNSEIYLHLPNGGGRSKLTNAYFDSKLSTVSTTRNWNTVCKLLELMSM